MKARPYFLPADQEKPKARQNQCGGTLGGPHRPQQAVLLRQLRGHRRQAGRAAIRHRADGGDAPRRFLRLADADLRPGDRQRRRRGRTAFAGNIIPRDRFDPIVQKLIADLPLPNQPGLVDNYFATRRLHVQSPQGGRQGELQPDEQARHHGRLGWIDYNFKNPPMFGDLGGLPVNNTAAKAGIGIGNT